MANEEERSNGTSPETEHPQANAAESPEVSAQADAASAANDPAETLALLEDARAKADEHWNQLLRANAELENTKRRARQDVENAHKYALEKFVQELIPVKDSLEMGLTAASQTDSDVAARFREGVELTLKMLSNALQKFAVKEINPQGEPFDPSQHQAMTLQESADHAPNTVLAVMQKGYQLNERLIRPAMVVVSKAAAAPAGDSTDAGQSDRQIDAKA